MGLVTEALSLRQKSFTPATLPQHMGSGGWPMWWRKTADPDYTGRVGDGSGTSIVGAVLNWMIRKFPEAPLKASISKNGVRAWLDQHEVSDLLNKPNPFHNGNKIAAGLIVSWVVDGNAYVLKVRNDSGRVVQLWYIPHYMIEPRGGEPEFIDYYEWSVNGVRYKVPVADIVHMRFGLDPTNPRKGRSQLKEQLTELYTDEEAALFSASMLQRSGAPGVIISPKSDDQEVDPEEAIKTKIKFDQEFGGRNRGSTMVLLSASDVSQYGFSPEQLTLRDLRAIPEERVTAALGIPAAVVGFGTGLASSKVGATMSEFREMAVEDSLVPTWRDFAEEWNQSVTPEFRGPDKTLMVGYDTTEVRVLQEDRMKLHTRIVEAWQAGLIPGTVAQAILGYPIDQARNVYRVPAIVAEYPASELLTGPAKQRLLGMKANVPKSELAFVRYVDLLRAAQERKFTSDLVGVFNDIGRDAAAEFDKRKSRLVVDAKADESLVNAITAALQLDRIITARVEPMYGGHYKAVADAVIEGYQTVLAVDIEIGVVDTVATRIIAEGGKRVGLLDITGDTRKSLFDALSTAREEGLGIPATARRIREYVSGGRFKDVNKRAELIARTETRYATNLSVAEAGKGAGFEDWRAYDDRTGFGDADCVARDGEVFTEDEMMAEIDAEHPNGTLSFSPVPRS